MPLRPVTSCLIETSAKPIGRAILVFCDEYGGKILEIATGEEHRNLRAMIFSAIEPQVSSHRFPDGGIGGCYCTNYNVAVETLHQSGLCRSHALSGADDDEPQHEGDLT